MADARTDVYSLGCVLFECLAGHPPFRAENDAAVMFGHLTEEPPPLTAERPDLPNDIDEVVATAMAKAPDDRYPSAGTFASRASAALGHPIDEPPSGRPARRRRGTRRRLSRRRRRATIGAVAGVVALLLGIVLLQVVGGEAARASFRPGIAIVDQRTGNPLASIPTSRISQPAEVIYVDGSFWVHNLEPNSFVQVDPQDGRVLTQIPAPFDEIGTFAVDGDTLWVTGPSVVKIDIGLRREIDRFDLPHPTHGVVVAEGSLWVTMPEVDTTLRLDPETGEVKRRFAELPGSLALAYGDGSIWTAGWASPFGGFTGSGGVNRIDPDTNAITTTTEPALPGECCPVAAGGGFGWTSDPTKGVVYKIDESGNVVATRPTGQGAAIGSFDGDRLGGQLRRGHGLGDRRDHRRSPDVPVRASGAGRRRRVRCAARDSGPGATYEDVIGGLDGRVAKFFVPAGYLAIARPGEP